MKLSIRVEDQSFEVEVGDLTLRPIQVCVEGEVFEVWPEEAEDAGFRLSETVAVQPVVALQPAAAPLPQTAPTNGTKNVLAPIPGVIVSISIKQGETVSFGQELCMLEAMKMKNLIRSNRSGKIAAIHVAPGDQVRHNQILLAFED
jgi:glutaconyl-CoA/methylmalonyl-CoA decarboxylase subunit gamma